MIDILEGKTEPLLKLLELEETEKFFEYLELKFDEESQLNTSSLLPTNYKTTLFMFKQYRDDLLKVQENPDENSEIILLERPLDIQFYEKPKSK